MSAPHIDVEDLAMFAMLPAGAAEMQPVASHLAACAECRAELARVREDLAWYALTVEPQPLPEGARSRFATRLHETTQTSASTLPAPQSGPVLVQKRRSPAAAVLAWAGWAAAAALLLMVFGLQKERQALRVALHDQHEEAARLQVRAAQADRILDALRDPQAVRVSLTTPKAPAVPAARASYDQRYGTLLMQASNLAPLRDGKVYELWVIPASGAAPIPVGVFTPDAQGNASLVASKLPEGVPAKAFGITVEHAGGSATPTMPIVLAGAPG